jgi:hypothetical protein
VGGWGYHGEASTGQQNNAPHLHYDGSTCHNIQAACRWDIKSMDIVPMHLRKMPLIYRGMVPSQSGPLWLQSGGHHGLGQYLRNGGNEILPRNSIIGT